MTSEEPRIMVGTRWITVCNGVSHFIFLEGDSGMYPTSCRCEDEFPNVPVTSAPGDGNPHR